MARIMCQLCSCTTDVIEGPFLHSWHGEFSVPHIMKCSKKFADTHSHQGLVIRQTSGPNDSMAPCWSFNPQTMVLIDCTWRYTISDYSWQEIRFWEIRNKIHGHTLTGYHISFIILTSTGMSKVEACMHT